MAITTLNPDSLGNHRAAVNVIHAATVGVTIQWRCQDDQTNKVIIVVTPESKNLY